MLFDLDESLFETQADFIVHFVHRVQKVPSGGQQIRLLFRKESESFGNAVIFLDRTHIDRPQLLDVLFQLFHLACRLFGLLGQLMVLFCRFKAEPVLLAQMRKVMVDGDFIAPGICFQLGVLTP
ncbi:hypothetical protein SDC9_117058 [bioreactor metagenome]|uniref:Uncharacterized protein n=1 Tax=bioreactor metagenome TaxID=1076179 RepID=A0A645BX67_9ZZZZ